MIFYIDPMCKVYQESGGGLNHENDHQYADRDDTVAVYVLHILLVRAVRDIRFGHAIRLCCALCVSPDRVYCVQAQKPGAGVSDRRPDGGCYCSAPVKIFQPTFHL